MKLTNFTIKDLLSEGKDLTFLVGAGCSIDQPSCLPAGKAMMEELIRYTCHESEVEKILQIEDLRFESLIEIIRDRIDKDLKVIDYYAQCSKPNMQHFFLAEMIKKSHFVMTTNFDFLIEYALLQSQVSENDIVPVITKQDFEQFDNPSMLLKQGKRALFKIHGSPKNVITGENTKHSLVATIQAFGSYKEGLDIFQMESFKRPLFENITDKRSLVVLGYSGSDDFDVVPTLKIIKNIQEIIWIDFLYEDGGKEKIYEINSSVSKSTQHFDKVNQILVEIYETGNIEKVFRVNVNTSRLVTELIENNPKLSSEKFSLSPIEWLKKQISPPSDVDKFHITLNIYLHFNRYDEVIDCAQILTLVSGLQPDNPEKAKAYSDIAGVYSIKADYSLALEFYEYAKQIYENINDLDGMASVLNGMGLVYKKQGKIEEALKVYEDAINLSKKNKNLSGIAILSDNIANIYREAGDLEKALEYQESAIRIFKEEGMLKDRATSLINIGLTYYQKADYNEALTHFEQALKISEQLKDERIVAFALEGLAGVYFNLGNLNEAVELRTKAVHIFQDLGLKKDEAIALSQLAYIMQRQFKYSKAIEYYEQALKIFRELEVDDLSPISDVLINLGIIHEEQKEFLKAVKYFKKSSQIYEKMNELTRKEELTKKVARMRNKLAFVSDEYMKQRNFFEAIEHLEKAIEVTDLWGDREGKAGMLIKIARIYKEQGKQKEALDSYQNAAQIFEDLDAIKFLTMALNEMGNLYANLGKPEESIKILEKLMRLYENKNMNNEKVDVLRDLGIVHTRMGHFNEALDYFELAVNLLKELGLDISEKAIFIKTKIEETKNSIRIKNISERF